MKKFAVILLAAFMVIGFSTTSSAAIQYPVWVDASSTAHGGDGEPDTTITLAPSEVVWLDVYISNIPIDDGLISSGLVVNFDPDQLEVTPGTVYDPFWPSLLSEITYNNDTGVIDFVGGTIFASDTATVALITIELHCIAPGVSFLDFGDHEAPFNDFVLASGLDLNGSVLYPIVEIINTPIPGALWLLGSGLVGLVGLRRRRS